MSVDAVVSRLKTTIASLRLSDQAGQTLFLLAQDPHGIEREACPSMVASSQDISMEAANSAIIELLGRELLRQDGPNEEGRLLANYEALQVDHETRELLIRRRKPFDDQGAPHSKQAMKGLDEFFEKGGDHIFLGLEVTSHSVFRRLESRAKAGRRTTFLIPKK
jgi:hypothetical protein